jgi:serine/threonine protein kinase
VTESNDSSSGPQGASDFSPTAGPNTPTTLIDDFEQEYSRFPASRSRSSSPASFERFRDGDARTQLEAELDSRWILNLSMHFRDRSDREKFFVTYAETPTRWRRVTISCDYRNAEPGSLEMDLKELQYQRDKSIQIFESIRDSLPEIQFYNTVTNLKLETSESRLHVHVTEDTNEIIPYPPKTSVEHILQDDLFRPTEIRESELAFDSHISGFVYKVRYCGKDYIKKEIPGPDTVDEFLYEINALHALTGSDSVIQLEAIVVDDQRETVKGLLISFAEQGALVDLLYDHKGEISWDDRVRWAQQAVQGLSEIHEEGYVQGDFTLSNIVIDSENNAKIIDINRRGCPVGWEPPEIAKKIQSNQRISMYIGEKSDLYQLGMTLWALAMDDDEPERHDSPLSTDDFPLYVPCWYINIVNVCLKEKPKDRLSAKELLKIFPAPSAPLTRPTLHGRSSTARAVKKEYIEPSAAVEREDIERLGFSRPRHTEDDFTSRDSTVDPVFTDARSSSYQFDSGSSFVDITRGRRPASNVAHLTTTHPEHQDFGLGEIDLPETCDFEPQIIPISPDVDREYDEVDLGGNRYLISRQSFDPEELDILDGHSHGRRRSVQNTLSRIESLVPETAGLVPADHNRSEAKNVDNAEDIKLEPNLVHAQQPPLGESSITSGSTPRNSSSILASSGTYVPPARALDLVTADLAGFGGHPSLDEHSPHEPKAVPALQFMAENHSSGEQPALPVHNLSKIHENINPVSEEVPAHSRLQSHEDSNPASQDITDEAPPIQASEAAGEIGEIGEIAETEPAVLELQQVQNTTDIHHENEKEKSATTGNAGDQTNAIPTTEASIYHDVPMSHSTIPLPTDGQTTEEVETQPQTEP